MTRIPFVIVWGAVVAIAATVLCSTITSNRAAATCRELDNRTTLFNFEAGNTIFFLKPTAVVCAYPVLNECFELNNTDLIGCPQALIKVSTRTFKKV